MGAFVSVLTINLERKVIDRTNLAGTYVIDFHYATGPSLESGGTPLFTALREQLGLKLESSRGAVDVLVIDHVEHPTPD